MSIDSYKGILQQYLGNKGYNYVECSNTCLFIRTKVHTNNNYLGNSRVLYDVFSLHTQN